MNKKMILQQDEQILSSLTGLVEIFDGIQTIYFGDLYLTNKRFYVMSTKQLNMEKSFWFEGELKEVDRSTFVVGHHRITVKWAYNGNLLYLKKLFKK